MARAGEHCGELDSLGGFAISDCKTWLQSHSEIALPIANVVLLALN